MEFFIEQWSREHPRKTRQDVFLKQWPNAAVYGGGDCRREFWMQEVE